MHSMNIAHSNIFSLDSNTFSPAKHFWIKNPNKHYKCSFNISRKVKCFSSTQKQLIFYNSKPKITQFTNYNMESNVFPRSVPLGKISILFIMCSLHILILLSNSTFLVGFQSPNNYFDYEEKQRFERQ